MAGDRRTVKGMGQKGCAGMLVSSKELMDELIEELEKLMEEKR